MKLSAHRHGGHWEQPRPQESGISLEMGQDVGPAGAPKTKQGKVENGTNSVHKNLLTSVMLWGIMSCKGLLTYHCQN